MGMIKMLYWKVMKTVKLLSNKELTLLATQENGWAHVVSSSSVFHRRAMTETGIPASALIEWVFEWMTTGHNRVVSRLEPKSEPQLILLIALELDYMWEGWRSLLTPALLDLELVWWGLRLALLSEKFLGDVLKSLLIRRFRLRVAPEWFSSTRNIGRSCDRCHAPLCRTQLRFLPFVRSQQMSKNSECSCNGFFGKGRVSARRRINCLVSTISDIYLKQHQYVTVHFFR